MFAVTPSSHRTNPRTEIRPLQRLVRQPHLEPSPALSLLEFSDGKTRPVHRNRIADVAVVQDGRGLADGQRTAACIVLNRSDRGEVFNLTPSGCCQRPMRAHPV